MSLTLPGTVTGRRSPKKASAVWTVACALKGVNTSFGRSIGCLSSEKVKARSSRVKRKMASTSGAPLASI
eukprot:scaffold516_cov270-Pinguiococcus_pyrenoidosus.AAC.2